MNRREHPGPWSEADFFALGETRERIELMDGELVVSPSPTRLHQDIVHNLTTTLKRAAARAGLAAFQGVDVRLAPGRILTPDVVAGKLGREPGAADAADIVLAGEVTSPGNATFDRTRKKDYYASAGIAAYLLAEPARSGFETVHLRLYRLDDGHYIEQATAEHGQTLVSDHPFPLAISTVSLLDLA